MPGFNFQINFLGEIWSEGFQFNENPAIEVVRNLDENEIYEKPFFDFKASGELFVAIERAMINNICSNAPIQILRDGFVVWDGFVRVSDVDCTFFSDQGNYKEIEVIDGNLNLYFKNRKSYQVDFDNPFDLECNRVNPPERFTVNFFEPSDPVNNEIRRQVYSFKDALDFVVLIISDGNVIIESDFFTTGEGKEWVFANGDLLANEFAIKFLPLVSWEEMSRFMSRTFRLFRYHYQRDGQQYVRIEPYDYFFSEFEEIKYDAVREVKFGADISRLWSTARVGDSNPVDENFDVSYTDFSFNTHEEQVVGVGGSCGSGQELELSLSAISVDTDKIEVAVTQGTTTKDYQKLNFVIETDGSNALSFTQGIYSYYNQTFFNGRILNRHFDGSNPVTVFPAESPDLNYFKFQQDTQSEIGRVIPAGLTNVLLGRLYFEADNIVYDPDATFTSFSSFNSIALNGLPSGSPAPDVTRFVCNKPGTYKIECDWNVFIGGAVFDWNDINPALVFCVVDHFNSVGGFIERFESDVGTQLNDGKTFIGNNIKFETLSMTLGFGDRIECFLKSNVIEDVQNGVISFGMSSGSYITTVPCETFVNDLEIGTKQQIYKTAFSGYPMPEADFDRIRENPGIGHRVFSYNCADEYEFTGFAERIKFDLITCQTDVELISAESFKSSVVDCWVLNDCNPSEWLDQCLWKDVRLWCDV